MSATRSTAGALARPDRRPGRGAPGQIDQRDRTPMTVSSLPTAPAADNQLAGLWPTSTAQGIINLMEVCRAKGQMGLITGASGIGKTSAARAAVRAAVASDAEAFYAALSPATENLAAGLFRIARAIGINADRNVSCNEVADAILRRLWQRGDLLVIDEAQYAGDALLHTIRSIWDELDARQAAPGIVLLGTPDLAERLNGGTVRKSRDFAPLRGRLGVMAELDGLAAEDFAAIARHYGLGGGQALKLVETAGRGRGGLHNVARLVAQARRNGEGEFGLAELRRAAELAGVA